MKARINTLVAKVVAWAKEYKADCDEYHRTHENQMFYIKKYWYIMAVLFTIPIAIIGLAYKLTKKDELERKLEEERRIDKKHYRIR